MGAIRMLKTHAFLLTAELIRLFDDYRPASHSARDNLDAATTIVRQAQGLLAYKLALKANPVILTGTPQEQLKQFSEKVVNWNPEMDRRTRGKFTALIRLALATIEHVPELRRGANKHRRYTSFYHILKWMTDTYFAAPNHEERQLAVELLSELDSSSGKLSTHFYGSLP